MPSYARAVAGTSLTLLSLVIGAFLVDLLLVGSVQHARAQKVGYAQLRTELAVATAPTGQLDVAGQLLRDGRPVALLTVAGLGLTREVVFEGTSSRVLAMGPGHLRASALPGQAGTAVLLGRAWTHGGPFGGLAQLPTGSQIAVTTGQGTHTYAVSGRRRAGDVVPPLGRGAGRLTLVTATGSALAPSGVVYVDADLTSRPVPAPARVLAAAATPAEELPLRGERAGWPVLVLLLEAFALSAVGLAWATRRFGRGPAWLAGTPVLVLTFVLCSEQVTRLLPNLL